MTLHDGTQLTKTAIPRQIPTNQAIPHLSCLSLPLHSTPFRNFRAITAIHQPTIHEHSLSCQNCHSFPLRSFPFLALPFHNCRTLSGLAQPQLSAPILPCRTSTYRSSPGLYHNRTQSATPFLPKHILPYTTQRYLNKPQALTAIPLQTLPILYPTLHAITAVSPRLMPGLLLLQTARMIHPVRASTRQGRNRIPQG